MKKSNLFGYPQFNDNNEMILTTYDNEYKEMLMDIRVYKLEEGQLRKFNKEDEEMAILLLSGNIKYKANNEEFNATRKNVFEEGPYCLHVSRNNEVIIEAKANTEILVQCTKNTKTFDKKFYTPKDAEFKYSHQGKFGNVANRRVCTIFDYDISPYSNMVLGEVLNDPGNWSGYLPHGHVQPEAYFFKFDREEGFGASFVGDEVFKSVNNSFSAIPGGLVHPQAVAPGFQMYTTWMIRHLDDKPWLQTDRCEDEAYVWLHDYKKDGENK